MAASGSAADDPPRPAGPQAFESRLASGFKLPLYPDARQAIYEHNEAFERETVQYRVSATFPPDRIVAFYENVFRAAGFIADPQEGYPMRRWEVQDETTGLWRATAQIPARYVATWVDSRRTIRIRISLWCPVSAGPANEPIPVQVRISLQKLFSPCDVLPWNRR